MNSKMDPLGRVVIPIQFRRQFQIQSGDKILFSDEGNTLTLRKADPCCVFCNSTEELFHYQEKAICRQCIEKIKEKEN